MLLLTLSNLTGKRIQRVKPACRDDEGGAGRPDSVEFEDGTVIDLTKQDFEFFKMTKPMIWL
jgi:hypothetical protein